MFIVDLLYANFSSIMYVLSTKNIIWINKIIKPYSYYYYNYHNNNIIIIIIFASAIEKYLYISFKFSPQKFSVSAHSIQNYHV